MGYPIYFRLQAIFLTGSKSNRIQMLKLKEIGPIRGGSDLFFPITVWMKDKGGLDHTWSFPGGSEDKESACNSGDPGSVPGLGRSSGGGHGNLIQCSCLENPMDRGAWWATVRGVAKRLIHTGVITEEIIKVIWFGIYLKVSQHDLLMN